MEKELWFNKTGNTGIQVYADSDRIMTSDNGTSQEENQVAPTTDTIECRRCANGSPITNEFEVRWRFDKQYNCPEGWTSNKYPCREKGYGRPLDEGVMYDEGGSLTQMGMSGPINLMILLPYVGVAALAYFLLK